MCKFSAKNTEYFQKVSDTVSADYRAEDTEHLRPDNLI